MRTQASFSLDLARGSGTEIRNKINKGQSFQLLPETKKTFNQLAEWFTGLKKIKPVSCFVAIRSQLKLFNEVHVKSGRAMGIPVALRLTCKAK